MHFALCPSSVKRRPSIAAPKQNIPTWDLLPEHSTHQTVPFRDTYFKTFTNVYYEAPIIAYVCPIAHFPYANPTSLKTRSAVKVVLRMPCQPRQTAIRHSIWRPGTLESGRALRFPCQICDGIAVSPSGFLVPPSRLPGFISSLAR